MREKYRYYATAGLTIRRELFPKNVRELSENFTLDDDDRRFAFKNELSEDLLFDKDDFAFLHKMEQSGDRCRPIHLDIERACGKEYEPFRTARLKLINGDWDLDKCTIKIKLTINNEYSCYDENKDTEINLLEPPLPKHKAHYLKGVLEYMDYTLDSYLIDDPAQFGGIQPALIGWKCYRVEYVTLSIIFGGVTTFKFFYAREKLTLICAESPGVGWIMLEDNCAGPGTKDWVRHPLLANYSKSSNGAPNGSSVLFTHDIIGAALPGSFDNGLLLQDVLSYYISNYCGIPIKSNFFQINPEATFAVTYPDFPDGETLNNLVYQKSDVKRSDVTNNATKALTTLETIIIDVFTLYNLLYRVEDGFFRIEHATWYERDVTLNLTLPKFKERVLYTRQYSYKTDKLPRLEIFKAKEAGSKDFVGLPIEYVGDCVSDDKSSKTKTYSLSAITTDVEYCIVNGASDNTKVSDEGLVLMATEPDSTGKLFIITEESVLDTSPRINNVLGWAHLHKTYHRHERLQLNGYMNGVYQTFLSTKASKKRKQIGIRFCCTDTINLNGIVNTEMGMAKIDQASFQLYQDELLLDLVYTDTIGNNACLRTKKFIFQERDGQVFYFLTEFELPGLYKTEIQIVKPNGVISAILIEPDETGIKPIDVGFLQDGIYKFRKRILCDTGYNSPWTDYVLVNTVDGGAGCAAIVADITYISRNHWVLKFLAQERITLPIQCEMTQNKPGALPKILNATTDPLPAATNVFVDTGYNSAEISRQIILGGTWEKSHRFRFRKVCNASTGTYSQWSNPIELDL